MTIEYWIFKANFSVDHCIIASSHTVHTCIRLYYEKKDKNISVSGDIVTCSCIPRK